MNELVSGSDGDGTMSEHVLETRELAIGYRPSRREVVRVAKGLNLSLQAGELVCLLGPNGAGKSTLMRTIAGMQDALAGQVWLCGEDATQLSAQQRAQRLSIVLTERPNVGLLNGYALVALGRHPHTNWTGQLTRYDEAVVRWAVEAVGGADLAERPVMELSDGQRQKFMIGRALAQESDLILLDEPTAYLDLPRRAEIMQLLRQLARETGRAILLSTHDLDLALRNADRLWLLSEGAIQAGAPEDLVLDGAFEAAFASEGVVFDRATGAFTVGQPAKRDITVSGEGVAYIWTCRALTRAGYTVTDDDASLSVCIGDDGTWHLAQGTTHTVYHSIADLLAALPDSGS